MKFSGVPRKTLLGWTLFLAFWIFLGVAGEGIGHDYSGSIFYNATDHGSYENSRHMSSPGQTSISYNWSDFTGSLRSSETINGRGISLGVYNELSFSPFWNDSAVGNFDEYAICHFEAAAGVTTTFSDQLFVPGSGKGFIRFDVAMEESKIAQGAIENMMGEDFAFYVNGTNAWNAMVPITFGQPFDINILMDSYISTRSYDEWALQSHIEQTGEGTWTITNYDLPSPPPGGNALWSVTARVRGARLFDEEGRPIKDPTITSASGIFYSVPEPTSVLFLGLGLLVCFTLWQWRIHRPLPSVVQGAENDENGEKDEKDGT